MVRLLSVTLGVLVLLRVAALPVAALPGDAPTPTCLSGSGSQAGDTVDLAVLLGLPADGGAEPTSTRCAQCANGAACCSSDSTCVTWCQGRGFDGGSCYQRCCICLVNDGTAAASAPE